jgi:YD repeat-containing protein
VALSRSFDYDAAGNLVRRFDRNGRVRAFDYDQNGRLVREIWYNTVADADLDRDRQNTINWTHDESGNLLSVVDDFSSYSYAYDSSGRVTTENVSNVGGPVTVITTEYGTRLDDQPVSRSATVDGTPDFVNRTITTARTARSPCGGR